MLFGQVDYYFNNIYRHIESAATGKPLSRKKGNGRKPKINTPRNRAKLTKNFNHRKGM